MFHFVRLCRNVIRIIQHCSIGLLVALVHRLSIRVALQLVGGIVALDLSRCFSDGDDICYTRSHNICEMFVKDLAKIGM